MTINQVVNVAREQAVKPKGFFKRVGSYMSKLCGGKTEKEVVECSGKSLNKMADITSIREKIQYYEGRINSISDLIEKTEKTWKEEAEFLSNARKDLEKAEHNLRYNKDMINGRNDFNSVAGDCYERGGETYAAYRARIDGYKADKDYATKQIARLEKQVVERHNYLETLRSQLKELCEKLDEQQIKLTQTIGGK